MRAFFVLGAFFTSFKTVVELTILLDGCGHRFDDFTEGKPEVGALKIQVRKKYTDELALLRLIQWPVQRRCPLCQIQDIKRMGATKQDFVV